MMKKVYYTLFTIALLAMFTPLVKADGTCSSTILYDERANASEITVSYEPVTVIQTDENSDPTSWEEHYLKIIINNIPDNVDIKVSSLNDTFKAFQIPSNKKDEENTMYIDDYETAVIKRMQFDIISTSKDCNGEVLKTLSLTTPMANEFSGTPICDQYPDFKYCSVFTDFDISSLSTTDFNKELGSYVEKIEKEENKEDKVTEKVAKTVKKYWYIVLVLVVIVGGLITYIVIKKKRSSAI